MIMGIFAKVGTNQKALLAFPYGMQHKALQILNDIEGGNWVRVDLMHGNEYLTFTDGEIYKGYDGRDGRFTDAIKKLP